MVTPGSPAIAKATATLLSKFPGSALVSRTRKRWLFQRDMGVEPRIGGGFYHPKWMVKIMGNPYEQMDDLGVFPIIFGNTHMIYIYI